MLASSCNSVGDPPNLDICSGAGTQPSPCTQGVGGVEAERAAFEGACTNIKVGGIPNGVTILTRYLP